MTASDRFYCKDLNFLMKLRTDLVMLACTIYGGWVDHLLLEGGGGWVDHLLLEGFWV